MSDSEIARRNLRYIVWQYVFSKRVFAPIIAIYLSEYAGLSLTTVGTVLAVATIVSLFLELPTGVFADKFGRATSIKIGSPLGVLSIICIVLLPNATGAFLWQILDAAAFAFMVFVANMTWWRFRPIYYSDHLLKGTKRNYKASMMSAVNVSTSVFAAATNFGLGVSADRFGILSANAYMIVAVLAISPLVWYAFLIRKHNFTPI